MCETSSSEATALLIDRTDTPIGELIVVTDRQGRLRAIDWTDHEDRMLRLLRLHHGKAGFVLEPAADPHGRTSALRAYFTGALDAIDAMPVMTAGTAFQRSVWRALRDIPTGQTISYAALARRIGRPAATRAAGAANGANPVSIVIPCHRVVGANGTLTGYGGGLHRKAWLLAHEGVRNGPG